MEAEMEHEAFSNLTNVQSFFFGQSVFITGFSGLVGKVVVEKLLRSCPGIGMIYVFIRTKRNLTPEQRLEKLLKLDLFKELKEVFPTFSKKIQIVTGDITKSKLGMDIEVYEQIQKNVSIVIHSAASVGFDDSIKKAADNNLLATKRVMELCQDLLNVKAVVHVSTLYAKREAGGVVLEETAKSKIPPEQLLNALEWMDEKTQKALEDSLLKEKLVEDSLKNGRNITYIITKAMAEALVEEKRGDLPIAVVRPAYITNTWREPFPGWIDQLQGFPGIVLAFAKGVLRAILIIPEMKANIIPVDVVSNAIITSAWHVGTTRPASIFVLNCAMDDSNVPYASELIDVNTRLLHDYPLQKIFRYPDFAVYYNKYAYFLHALFTQWIPAAIIDLLLLIFTGRTILLKTYRKIHFLSAIFRRLTADPCVYRMKNYQLLLKKLSNEDAEMFYIDTENLNFFDYAEKSYIGGRKTLGREDPSNLAYAKRKAKIWWTVTTFLKWLIILYFFYYLFSRGVFSPLFKSIEENIYTVHS